MTLAVDTGATRTLMEWNAAVLLGHDPASVPELKQIVTGSTVESAPEVAVEKPEAFELERTSFPVLCHRLPPEAGIDGLLGLDFFRGLRLVVDLREGFVSVE